jgi:hypothetical protein
MSDKILRLSKPIDRSHGRHGYGGSNRTLQLDEILTEHHIEWNEASDLYKAMR